MNDFRELLEFNSCDKVKSGHKKRFEICLQKNDHHRDDK